MLEKREKKKISKTAKIILIVVTVLAALLVIAGLNKPHTSPFTTSVSSMYEIDRDESDKGGVIIDEQGKRLLFTDMEGKLVTVVDLTKSGSLINKAFEVKIEDETARVHGGYAIQDGIYFSSESIVDYTLGGNVIGEEYRQDYGEDERISSPQFTISGIDAASAGTSDEQEIEEDVASAIASSISPSITSESVNRTEIINYSTWYMIKNIVYWLGAAWIIAIALWFGVYVVIKKSSTKTLIVAIGIACILFTAVYYTVKDYHQIRGIYEKTISTLTQQSTIILNDSIADELVELSEEVKTQGASCLDDPEKAEFIKTIQDTSKTICDIYGTAQSGGMIVFINDGTEKLYVLSDSREILPTGTEVVISEEEKEAIFGKDSQEVFYLSGTVADILTDFGFIQDEEGKTVATVEAFAYEDNILANQTQQGVDTFITLLAIFIGLYMVGSCIVVFSADIKRRNSRDKNDLGNRASDMSGIYMFAYKLTCTIDEVIVVYVAESLCVGMDPALEAVMVAMPLTLYGVGRWVGTFFATPFIKKFGESATGVINCLLGVGTAILIIFSIKTSNIYLYSLGKGLWGFALSGALFVISDTLPLSASDDKQMQLARDSSQQSVSAAGIITALISGYISQYVGYSVVYLAGGVMAVLLLVLTIMTFGKKKSSSAAESAEDTEKAKGNYKDYWLVFLKPEMLMYVIFYVLPTVLAGGYSTYLFPLYSAGAGISVVLLSNINVFSKALMYVTNKPLTKMTEGMNKTTLMTLPMLLTCVGLLCFVISPNIYWAIIMLFAGAVLSRMTNVSAMMYRVDVSDQYGLDSKLVSSNYYTVQSAINIFQSPILSAFMTLGANAACAAVGGVCGVLFMIFGGYNRKHGGQKEKSENA